MCDEKFLIMMASYNGHDYLEQQIKSIQAQRITNWHLIVQDDGSNDDSVDIIRKMSENDDRIELWINNSEKHGPYYNFHSLINKCKKYLDYDYYLFADQDDVWKEDKLNIFREYAQKENKEDPLLIYGDMCIVDDETKLVNTSINSVMNNQYTNATSVFFTNFVFGCNLMVNNTLFRLVPPVDLDKEYVAFLSHDNLYTKFAAILGKIVYIPEQTMMYRRHGKNVTAKQDYSIGISRIIARIMGITDLAKDHAKTFDQSLIEIEMIRELCKDEKQLNLLEQIERTIRRGGILALKNAIALKINCGNKVRTCSRISLLCLKLSTRYITY